MTVKELCKYFVPEALIMLKCDNVVVYGGRSSGIQDTPYNDYIVIPASITVPLMNLATIRICITKPTDIM